MHIEALEVRVPRVAECPLQTGLQTTPLNPLAVEVEWMDLNPRSPSV
jgi:hypothetical protein